MKTHKSNLTLPGRESITDLTPREQACLKMGVPSSGNPEIDRIINEGNRRRSAEAILSALIGATDSKGGYTTAYNETQEQQATEVAVRVAGMLQAELNETAPGRIQLKKTA